MDLNSIEIRRATSEFIMRAALFTSVSIIIVNAMLWLLTNNELILFVTCVMFSIAAISSISLIRYVLLFRKSIMEGCISYFQSLLFSVRFFFFSGMILTLGLYSFLYFHPSFISDFFANFENLREQVVAMGQNPGITEVELQQNRDVLTSSSNFSIAVDLWFTYLFAGTLFSLILSLLVQGGKPSKVLESNFSENENSK